MKKLIALVLLFQVLISTQASVCGTLEGALKQQNLDMMEWRLDANAKINTAEDAESIASVLGRNEGLKMVLAADGLRVVYTEQGSGPAEERYKKIKKAFSLLEHSRVSIAYICTSKVKIDPQYILANAGGIERFSSDDGLVQTSSGYNSSLGEAFECGGELSNMQAACIDKDGAYILVLAHPAILFEY